MITAMFICLGLIILTSVVGLTLGIDRPVVREACIRCGSILLLTTLMIGIVQMIVTINKF